jgi:hypothetical protein
VASKKQRQLADRQAILDQARPDPGEAMAKLRGQLKTAAKVVAIAVVVVWLLALGFWSGLDSPIPLYVALVLTLGVGVGVFMVRRNLEKSEAYGALLGQTEMTDEQRADRLARLEADAAKGDANALLAKAQLEMQDEPEKALATLERVDLEKAPKVIGAQVRVMRAMLHLNQGEIKAARTLADAVDLSTAPDSKSRANLAAVVAEAWARSGNPIEATEQLAKYDPDDAELKEVRLQLLRARAFAAAHKNDVQAMTRALKQLEEISPQLMAMFVGRRVHPLLEQEAKRLLERSGVLPKAKVQFQRR